MTSPKLELRSIDKLLDDAFVIPSYQRGYRWSEVEVKALLDDLDEFRQTKRRELQRGVRASDQTEDHRTAVGNFYCLQPVVVLPRGTNENGRKRWELVDGQQRLTTIYLIIMFLESEKVRVRGRFSLEYETHKNDYLTSLDPELRWESPDAYYMHQAFESIRAWFKARPFDAPQDMAEVLLSSDERGLFNSRVIWYELSATDPDSQAEIDAFIRLNAGKIRLTNAELIRALFLKAGNFKANLRNLSQLKMAQEWDRIEKRLQNDRFWYFLHGSPSPYATRIDHVFAVYLELYESDLLEKIPPATEFRSFLCYQELDKRDRTNDDGTAGRRVAKRWDEVRALAQRLEEWEQDRVLYHLIGFWITYCVDSGEHNARVVVDLLKRRKDSQHNAFEEGLKASIFMQLVNRKVSLEGLERDAIRQEISNRLEDLTYGSKAVRPMLLLFNIATLLQNGSSTVRFPFDLFNKQRWDIEHIRSVESGKPESVPDRKAWLGMVIEYWTGRPSSELLSFTPDALVERREAVSAQLDQVDEAARLTIPSSASESRPTTAANLLRELGVSSKSGVTVEPDRAMQRDDERAHLELKVAKMLANVWLQLSADRFEHKLFDSLYDQILDHFEEKDAIEADNSIGNLTLLDVHTNRSYQNVPFPVKRKRILALDKTGTFVPRCTTNLFLKYYSRRLDQLMTWSETCADSYQEAIADVLTDFFERGGHRSDGETNA